MNAPVEPSTLAGASAVEEPAGLALLRADFPPHHISKLPKETKNQADARKADQQKGVWPPKCSICDGYHHPKAVHLDYVGHAALTDRLLDVDPQWSWEPVGFASNGLPAFDDNGGLWIRLTVCGMTRLGYGNAEGKKGGDAVKEIIGDALRNAAMRFGAALELWHRGDLHLEEEGPSAADTAIAALRDAASSGGADKFKEVFEANKDGWKALLSTEDTARVWAVKDDLVKHFTNQKAARERQAEMDRQRAAAQQGGTAQNDAAADQTRRAVAPVIDDSINI